MTSVQTYTRSYLDKVLISLIPLNLTAVSERTDKVTTPNLEPSSSKVYNVIMGTITVNNQTIPVSGAWDYGYLTTNSITIGAGLVLAKDGEGVYSITSANSADVIDITKTRLITMAQ